MLLILYQNLHNPALKMDANSAALHSRLFAEHYASKAEHRTHSMDLEIISPIRNPETFAYGTGIREIVRLRKNMVRDAGEREKESLL